MVTVFMHDVKEKLSSARSACPGLSEEVYALADYMAENANDKQVVPAGMTMLLVLSLHDIQNGKCGFTGNSTKLPQYLVEHKLQVLAQAVYFPQIIDAVADEEFATEFRKLCKEMLEFDPPKRAKPFDVNEKLDDPYPENVVAAVNWWANAVVNPKFDNGDNTVNDFMAFIKGMVVNQKSSITSDQIKTFKKALAEHIMDNLKTMNQCHLSVDYNPDYNLAQAAIAAGIDTDITGFSWKTHMVITNSEVRVACGYGAPYEVIWSAEEK